MALTTVHNDQAANVREVLAFVLRTRMQHQTVSWVALREALEQGLEHWPEQPAAQTRTAREAATMLIRELQQTFVAGRSARAVAVGPEVPLVRFAGSSMEARPPFTVHESRPAGLWWFDARWLDRLRGAMDRIDPRGALWTNRGESLRDLLRDRLAVRHDWNTMTRTWRLHLAPGSSVMALVGRTRRQPTWSRELVLLHEAGEFLPGGLEQYYIPHLDEAPHTVSRVG